MNLHNNTDGAYEVQPPAKPPAKPSDNKQEQSPPPAKPSDNKQEQSPPSDSDYDPANCDVFDSDCFLIKSNNDDDLKYLVRLRSAQDGGFTCGCKWAFYKMNQQDKWWCDCKKCIASRPNATKQGNIHLCQHIKSAIDERSKIINAHTDRDSDEDLFEPLPPPPPPPQSSAPSDNKQFGVSPFPHSDLDTSKFYVQCYFNGTACPQYAKTKDKHDEIVLIAKLLVKSKRIEKNKTLTKLKGEQYITYTTH